MDIRAILGRPGTLVLDTARADRENRSSFLYTEPVEVLEARALDEVHAVLERVELHRRRGGYAAGYLQYEAGYAMEPALRDLTVPRTDRLHPLAWIGLYDRRRRVDADVLFSPGDEELDRAAVEDARLSVESDAYLHRVRAVQEAIREGEVYQVNFTAPVRFRYEGQPSTLYRALRMRQPVPYGAYLRTSYGHVLSLTPELFFRRRDRRIWTRPMKGTIGRGRTREEDRAQAETLARDPKSRAENLMIVDLLRNDLSRLCRPDSVGVEDLFATEIHPTLIQMTSTVRGHLDRDATAAEVMRALFPCGSVTGAPKIRAMRLIRELESYRRGIYCGAIGHWGPGPEATFSVAIRTAVLEAGRGTMGTGSGIVSDSDPAAEHRESRLKTHFLTRIRRPVRLIETLRWSAGYPLLRRHLDRLARSAAYFGYPLHREETAELLARRARALDPARTYKVRLTLGRTGEIAITHEEIVPACDVLRVRVAAEAIRSDDRYRLHKTTRRKALERAFRTAREEGYDDALLTNERGELTEATRWNLFVRAGRSYRTPPVDSGALPGVYRAHLLERLPRAEVRPIRPEELREADRVYLCNAVRGLRVAEVEGAGR